MNKNETENIFVFIPKEIWKIFLIYVSVKNFDYIHSLTSGRSTNSKIKKQKKITMF